MFKISFPETIIIYFGKCVKSTSGQNQQKITVEEFIFSAVSGYVAWNHTKNKLLHSDFCWFYPLGVHRAYAKKASEEEDL